MNATRGDTILHPKNKKNAYKAFRSTKVAIKGFGVLSKYFINFITVSLDKNIQDFCHLFNILGEKIILLFSKMHLIAKRWQ